MAKINDNGLFLALDSNMVRALTELDKENKKHEENLFNFQESDNFFIKNHGGYLWGIYTAIKRKKIIPVIVEPVFKETAYNDDFLNFMIDYCYFPKDFLNLKESSYEIVKNLASLYTTNIELMVFNSKTGEYVKREYASVMKKNYNSHERTFTFNNDTNIAAFCGLYNVCLLTADSGFFGKDNYVSKTLRMLNMRNDFYPNESRPVSFFEFGPLLRNGVENIELSEINVELFKGADFESFIRTHVEKETATKKVPMHLLKNNAKCYLVSKQAKTNKTKDDSKGKQ